MGCSRGDFGHSGDGGARVAVLDEGFADEDGARLTGDPLGLASALQKIAEAAKRTPMAPTRRASSMAHMFIANPFSGDARVLFSTHPPVEERVARLHGMAGLAPGTQSDELPS